MRTNLDYLDPEVQLLMLAAGGPKRADALRERLERGVDWPRLWFYVEREHADPGLWRALRVAGAASVPAEHRETFEKLAAIWQFRLMHAEKLLRATLDRYRGEGIESVLLKGSAVAYSLYGSFLERPMGDLDILVRSEDAERAWELAQGCGWRWDAEEFPAAQYVGHHHLPPLRDCSGSGFLLEVHTDLARPGHPFRFGAREVWASAQELPVEGGTVRVPSALHQLLHCCTHFAWGHRMRRKAFLTFSDVAAYVRKWGLDGEALVRSARDARAQACCYWTLRLSRNLVGVAVPPELLGTLRPRLPEAICVLLERHFAHNLMRWSERRGTMRIGRMLFRLAIGGGSGGDPMPLLGKPSHGRVEIEGAGYSSASGTGFGHRCLPR